MKLLLEMVLKLLVGLLLRRRTPPCLHCLLGVDLFRMTGKIRMGLVWGGEASGFIFIDIWCYLGWYIYGEMLLRGRTPPCLRCLQSANVFNNRQNSFYNRQNWITGKIRLGLV